MDLTPELQERGVYQSIGAWYSGNYAMLTPPISPKENMLRYFAKKDYCWIPDGAYDQVDVAPDINPDLAASGYSGGIDSFGVKWVALENGLPAMVEPGHPLLEDITDWRSLKLPDVSSWDWEGYAKRFPNALTDERYVRGKIPCGFFERLISLMDVEEAAVALVTEPEEVYEFFGKLADMNVSLVEHYKKYLNADGVMLHDDWGSQRAPFFSLNTVRELIMPHLKRVVDRAHELGMHFTFHSCGNGLDLAPAMIEAGIDAWQFQENAVDLKKAKELYGDKIVFETFWDVPAEMDDEAAQQHITAAIRRVAGDHRGIPAFYDFSDSHSFDLRKFMYCEERRMIAQ